MDNHLLDILSITFSQIKFIDIHNFTKNFYTKKLFRKIGKYIIYLTMIYLSKLQMRTCGSYISVKNMIQKQLTLNWLTLLSCLKYV